MTLKDLREKYLGVDGLLVSAGVLVVTSALYFFFAKDDGLGRVQFEKSVPVGHFSSSHNDVRRRTHTGFTWGSANQSDAIFEADSIFTGDSSEASVTLNNGDRLDIDAKSLVVIRTRGSQLQLDLQYGSLVGKINKATPIVISQNGQLQEISSDDAEIRLESSGPHSETLMRVIKGEVHLRKVAEPTRSVETTPTKKPKLDPVAVEPPPQVIKQNEVAHISEAPVAVVTAEPIELLAPINGTQLWLPPGREVEFKWSAPIGSGPYRLEVSSDNQFTPSSILSTFDTPTELSKTVPSKELKLRLLPERLPAGPFYWRISAPAHSTAVSPKIKSSGSSKLMLFADLPPLPLFPADHQEFSFDTAAGESGKQILMSWEDKYGSLEFEVQLARDENFKDIIFTKQAKMLTESSPMLSTGSYFWHIKGTNPARGNPPWSRTFTFNISEELKTPEAPVLAASEITYEIPARILANVPPSATLIDAGVMPEGIKPFSWNSVKFGESYEVELATNDKFINSLKTPAKDLTSFAPSEVRPGALYLRVRAKGRTGLTSQPSATGKLVVALPPPVLQPIPGENSKFTTQDLLEKAKHEFALKWSKLPYAPIYELNWGADQTFEKSKKFKLSENFRTISVTRPGSYAARVRAIGPDGEPISAYSNIEMVTFNKELLPPLVTPAAAAPPPLAAPPKLTQAPPLVKSSARKPSNLGLSSPILIEPLRKTSFVSIDDSVPFINLKWRKVKGARSYSIEISEDADFTKPIESFSTSLTSFTVKTQLPEGRVYWRVRATGKSGLISDWSNVYDINVLYQ